MGYLFLDVKMESIWMLKEIVNSVTLPVLVIFNLEY